MQTVNTKAGGAVMIHPDENTYDPGDDLGIRGMPPLWLAVALVVVGGCVGAAVAWWVLWR